jgi:hypothetical protein
MSNEVKQTVSSESNGAAMSNDGIRYTPVCAGIKIDDSSSSSEILITQILSEEALFDSLTVKASGETIGNAGALLYGDGVPFAWSPGNPNRKNNYACYKIDSTWHSIYSGKSVKKLETNAKPQAV